ncbi:spore germination protein [Clostridium felsineum]|uniref:GerAB/ArcD/ProY family transporter n=1 Tax=Clostridium felsineum TaxID=36839 RepID=UPI00098C1A33|nr:GerAB/ArcD/ProY family transporter [Clostridium felsineum]MCR3757650.1 spore germination protein [Clostridium felsineum]URZ14584.1 Spore germination protein YndE [Clostridium felsineum DSM 794]
MEKKICGKQMFSLIVLCVLGSSIIFFLNPEAEQNAWIGILIYIIPALIIEYTYVYLWEQNTDDSIIQYMPKIWGKFLGSIFSFFYLTFFVYTASRVLRNLTVLIITASMPKIPIFFTAMILMFVCWYGVYLGIENIARLMYVFLFFWIIFFTLEWIFFMLPPNHIHLKHLLPILENGPIPVIKNSLPVIAFPFGENIISAMLFPLVSNEKSVKKYALFSVILQGILISLSTILFLLVLGVKFSTLALFPFLQTLRILKISEYFDRLDIFAIVIVVILSFVKVSVFCYGAVRGTAELFKIKNSKWLSIPISILILIMSRAMASNFPQHIHRHMDIFLKYLNAPLTIVLPFITIILFNLKKLLKENK